MRLAVDARPFEERPTGVGRYLEGLLSAWLDQTPSDSFILLSPRKVHVPARLAGRVEAAASPALPGTVWLQTAAARAARRAGADAFFGSLGILPLLSSLPGVATVHDLTPLLFPEWHSRKNRLGFNPFIGATVRRDAPRPRRRVPRCRAEDGRRAQRRRARGSLGARPGTARREAVCPLRGHARAAQERRAARRRDGIDLGSSPGLS